MTLNGTSYAQHPIATIRRPPNDDPCYWCAAYNNMRLCDVLCTHCKEGFVFMSGRNPHSD